MPEFIPFRFKVELFAVDPRQRVDNRVLCEAAFSEVSGLEATMTPRTLKEGGRNWGEIHLAGPVTFAPVVLKRGMTSNGQLWTWFDLVHRRAQYDFRLSGDVSVCAPDKLDKTLFRYRLEGVLPTKFRGPALSSTASQVAIEELELVHEGFELLRPTEEETRG